MFIGVGKEGEVMERVAKHRSGKLKAVANDTLIVSFESFPALYLGDTSHQATYSAFEALCSGRQNKPRSRKPAARFGRRTDCRATLKKSALSSSELLVLSHP